MSSSSASPFTYTWPPSMRMSIARHADHALDVALRGIARIAEHHDIAALDRFQPIHKLVDEDSFLVFERRHHAGAFHFHRLIQENDDEGGDRQRDNKVTEPDAKAGPDAQRFGQYLRDRRRGRRGHGSRSDRQRSLQLSR